MAVKGEEVVEQQEKEVRQRLEFLYDKFNVGDVDEKREEWTKVEENEDGEEEVIALDGRVERVVGSGGDIVIGAVKRNREKPHKIEEYVISKTTFKKVVEADPTTTKIYTQWLLNKLIDMFKGKRKKDGVRFSTKDAQNLICEDLPKAHDHLKVFEKHKRKKKFKKLAKGVTTLDHIKDPSDINQYEDLTQLYDAIEFFMEEDNMNSDLEKAMDRYVRVNEGKVEFRDRYFTVFVPGSQEACTIFKNVANWCNVRTEGSMYDHYVYGDRRPDGSPSKLYIIMNNDVLKGESKELYQVHFETDQIKTRRDEVANVNIYEPVIKKSKGISDYFYNELYQLAKDFQKHNPNTSIEKNVYIDHLLKFGFSDSLFDFLKKGETPYISLVKKDVSYLPDLTKFKDELKSISVNNNSLTDIHPNIGELKELKYLVLTNTNLKELPSTIGKLKNLKMLNVNNNANLNGLPDTIEELDPSNGGSLELLVIDENNPDKDRSSELLPNVIIESEIGFKVPTKAPKTA